MSDGGLLGEPGLQELFDLYQEILRKTAGAETYVVVRPEYRNQMVHDLEVENGRR